MKTIVKIIMIAVLTSAALPVQAMFNRLGQSLKTVHAYKKPLIAGATLGIGGTIYRMNEKHTANTYHPNFNCKTSIAKLIQATYIIEPHQDYEIIHNKEQYNQLLQKQKNAFEYCKKSMTTEQLLYENYNFARERHNDEEIMDVFYKNCTLFSFHESKRWYTTHAWWRTKEQLRENLIAHRDSLHQENTSEQLAHYFSV